MADPVPRGQSAAYLYRGALAGFVFRVVVWRVQKAAIVRAISDGSSPETPASHPASPPDMPAPMAALLAPPVLDCIFSWKEWVASEHAATWSLQAGQQPPPLHHDGICLWSHFSPLEQRCEVGNEDQNAAALAAEVELAAAPWMAVFATGGLSATARHSTWTSSLLLIQQPKTGRLDLCPGLCDPLPLLPAVAVAAIAAGRASVGAGHFGGVLQVRALPITTGGPLMPALVEVHALRGEWEVALMRKSEAACSSVALELLRAQALSLASVSVTFAAALHAVVAPTEHAASNSPSATCSAVQTLAATLRRLQPLLPPVALPSTRQKLPQQSKAPLSAFASTLPRALHPRAFRLTVFLEVVAAAGFFDARAVLVAYDLELPQSGGWTLLLDEAGSALRIAGADVIASKADALEYAEVSLQAGYSGAVRHRGSCVSGLTQMASFGREPWLFGAKQASSSATAEAPTSQMAHYYEGGGAMTRAWPSLRHSQGAVAQASEKHLIAEGVLLPAAQLHVVGASTRDIRGIATVPLKSRPLAVTVPSRTRSAGGGPHALADQRHLLQRGRDCGGNTGFVRCRAGTCERNVPSGGVATCNSSNFASGGGSVSLLTAGSLDGGCTPATLTNTSMGISSGSGERASLVGITGLTRLLNLAGGVVANAVASDFEHVAHIGHHLELHFLWQPPALSPPQKTVASVGEMKTAFVVNTCKTDDCLPALEPPQMRLRVISQDAWGLQHAAGIASLPLPLAAGAYDHVLPVSCPRASLTELERDFLLGGSAAAYAVKQHPTAQELALGESDAEKEMVIDRKASLGGLGLVAETNGSLALRTHSLLVRAPPIQRLAASTQPPLPSATALEASAHAAAAARSAALANVLADSRELAMRLCGDVSSEASAQAAMKKQETLSAQR